MTKMLPLSSAVRTKRGRKYDDVIAGARSVFLRDGFDGANVDQIAREAGVSKATLYSYFDDKRLLFMEVARLECAQLAEQAEREIDVCQPPEVVLPFAGRTILGFICSPLGLGVFRLCVAEAERFPELGRLYYTSGPKTAHVSLTTYLEACVARGQLDIKDLELASNQFCELCRSDVQTKMLFGIDAAPDEAEVTRIVDSAVAMFLARYKTR